MHLLQRIDPLLEVDVVGRELGLLFGNQSVCGADKQRRSTTHLVLGLSQLLLGVLEGTRGEGRNLRPKVPINALRVNQRSLLCRVAMQVKLAASRKG